MLAIQMSINCAIRNAALAFLSIVYFVFGILAIPAQAAAEADAWLAHSLSDRQRMVEIIGENGAREYAEARGWNPLYNRHTPDCIPQGPDQVYIDTATGRLKVIEAKGGNASVRQSYGVQQGSPEWAVKSSEAVLKSPHAGAAQKRAAREILEKAAAGKMDAVVVKTPHVLGRAGKPVVKASIAGDGRTAKLAKEILANASVKQGARSLAKTAAVSGKIQGARNLSRAVAAGKATLARAGKAGRVATPAIPVTPVVVVVTVVDSAMDIYDVESRYAEGKIDADERVKAHTANGMKTVAGFGGMMAGAKAGAVGGAAAGALAGGVGAPIGAAVGSFVGAVGGYFGATLAVDELVDWLW
ncbi:MAG: hypothetical protein LBT97_02300 [Planctomycetota bacterium]|jgi:hypothetical protein|nr:hypothetical protein [Planctomycetota bacterium]